MRMKEGTVRLAGRLAILIIAVAAAAWAAWYFLLQRQDVQLDLFERDAKARWSAAAPKPPEANTFRATVCATSPCLLVEAGGLAFLVGAGAGSAEGFGRKVWAAGVQTCLTARDFKQV